MGVIFKPEPLSWEDIEGGRGYTVLERIRAFIENVCYPDEHTSYLDDEELPNELAFFAEEWARLDGWPSYRKKVDAIKASAVLSLIDGAFYDNMARERIVSKLTKSATKPDLVEIVTRVASAYCWYIALKARIEIAELRKEQSK